MSPTGRLAPTALAAAMVTACLWTVVASAEPPATTPMTAAVPRSWPPLYQPDGQGGAGGFGVQLMNEVARRAGVTLTYRVEETFADTFEALRRGDADLIPMLAVTEARMAEFAFGMPVQTDRILVFVRTTATDIDGLEDLAGRPVALVDKTLPTESLAAGVAIRPVTFDKVSEALFALIGGAADALILSEGVVWKRAREAGVADLIKVVGEPVREFKRAMVVRKEDRALLDRFDPIIARVLRSPEYRRIYTTWYQEAPPYWTPRRILAAMGLVIVMGTIALLAWHYRAVVALNARLRATVADLEAAEAAIRTNENRFRDFAESASDWFWEMGPDLRFNWLSQPQEFVAGVSRQSIVGKTRQEFAKGDDDDPVWMQHRKDLLARRPFKDFRYLVTSDSGEDCFVSVNGVPVYDENGTFQGYRGTATNVTEQVAAETRLQDAIESIADGFALFDADDRFVLCNENYTQAFSGVSHMLVPGVRFEELARVLAERGDVVDARGRAEEWVRERMAIHRSSDRVHEHRFRGGQWIEIREYRTRDGGTAIIRANVTARKRAELAVRDSEERLRGIMDTVRDGIVAIDESGAIDTFNPAAESLFGYTADEVIGKNVHVLIPESSRAVHDGHLDRLARGQVDISVLGGGREVEGRRKDGSVFPVELTISILQRDGHRFYIGVIRDITDRKQAEEILRLSQRILDAIPEQVAFFAPAATGGPVEYVYRYVNRAYAQAHGVDGDNVGGTGVRAAVSDAFFESCLRPHLDACLGGEEARLEQWIAFPDDHERYMATVFLPLRGQNGEVEGIAAVGRDITARKRAEEALRQSETRFRVIAQTSPVGIMMVREADSVVLFANRALSTLVGVSAEDLAGRDVRTLCYEPKDTPAVIAAPRAHATGAVETRFRHADGTVRWVLVSSQGVEYGGDTVILSSVTDVTEARLTQQQLAQTAKMATLGEMASGMAHELNQPLSVISMAAEFCLLSMDEQRLDPAVLRSKLETIGGQTERMAEIIGHMRLFSRKERDEEPQTFDPRWPLASAVDLLADQFRLAGIRMEQALPVTCAAVSGRPLRLEQVLLNLLNNARDAVLTAAADGGADFVPTVTVEVIDDAANGMVVIAVCDNGGGIAEDDLGRVFDPFFTTKAEGEGTGLGLSISFTLVHGMGGRLTVSNVNDGARFEIALPAAPQAAETLPESPAAATAAGQGTPTHEGPVRVLVVEDEDLAAHGMADYLRHKGYAVDTVGNGAAALDRLGAWGADVVITDLRMPVMDGNDLLRELRKRGAEVPVIVATGHTNLWDEQDIVAEGAAAVLKKPVRLQDLKDAVDRVTNGG